MQIRAYALCRGLHPPTTTVYWPTSCLQRTTPTFTSWSTIFMASYFYSIRLTQVCTCKFTSSPKEILRFHPFETNFRKISKQQTQEGANHCCTASVAHCQVSGASSSSLANVKSTHSLELCLLGFLLRPTGLFLLYQPRFRSKC